MTSGRTLNENPEIRPAGVGAAARRLRGLAVGGTASIAFGVLATNALRIVSSMTLTRLLSAEAFGIVGILISAAVALTMLFDIGIYPFIVRHKQGDERAFQDQVWTLRLARSVVLALALIALARPIALFVGQDALTPVLMVWSASFVIEGLSSLTFATAVRRGTLWKLTWLEVAAGLVQLVVSVAIALLLPSYWAIVGGLLVGAAFKAVLSYTLFPGSGRRLAFDRERMREMWRFSRFIAPSSLLSLLIMQADKFVLARLLPLATFGLYTVATTLVWAPAALAHQYAARVLLPVYAAAARESPERLRAIFYPHRRLIGCLYMLGIGVMIGGAPLIVEILYDDRYRPVASIMRILSLSVLLRLNNDANEQALIAAGSTRSVLAANVARVGWLGLGGAAGLLLAGPSAIVWVVGLLEGPAMASYWRDLRRERLLVLREEALSFAAALVGMALGWGAAEVGLMLIRA